MTALIRPATPADVEAILTLFPRLAAFPIPPERRPEDLWQGDAELLRRWGGGGAPQCVVLVAVNTAQAIVGAALTQLREELISHEPSAHLEVLAVGADAEGQGIGQRLIEETERAVQLGGAESLTLHVFARNTRARAVYERLGFGGELIRYIKFFNHPSGLDVAARAEVVPEAGRVLALSGSLRRDSSNGVLLDAAAQLAPAPMRLVRFDRLGQLPHFNPDLDGTDPATIVTAFRREVAAAAGLVISSPEYAHGVPGSLKNALDWLVSGVEIVGKPVLLLNASAMAVHAQAALRETLTTMAAVVLPEAQVPLPADARHRGPRAIVADPELAGRVLRGLTSLSEAMATTKGER